jgi:antitoxin (DNA-binding transcriptional repressor) of toxin-antitoxin stability system
VLRTTNIRTLKDKLSAFLRDVQRGDVVLVTDRGRVVAEIRKPTLSESMGPTLPRRAQRLVDEGILRGGLPNSPEAYRPGRVRVRAEVVDDALSWTRGDR